MTPASGDSGLSLRPASSASPCCLAVGLLLGHRNRPDERQPRAPAPARAAGRLAARTPPARACCATSRTRCMTCLVGNNLVNVAVQRAGDGGPDGAVRRQRAGAGGGRGLDRDDRRRRDPAQGPVPRVSRTADAGRVAGVPGRHDRARGRLALVLRVTVGLCSACCRRQPAAARRLDRGSLAALHAGAHAARRTRNAVSARSSTGSCNSRGRPLRGAHAAARCDRDGAAGRHRRRSAWPWPPGRASAACRSRARTAGRCRPT